MDRADAPSGASPRSWPPLPLPSPTIRAEDLLLRTWRPEDSGALARAWADPEIRTWSSPPTRSLDEMARRWTSGEAERRAKGVALDLVVERRGQIVGEVGLSQMAQRAFTAVIGYWVAAPVRGEGLATRAVNAVLAWSETTLGMRVALARTEKANVASVRTLERCRFELLTEAGQGGLVYAWRSQRNPASDARAGERG